MSEKIWSPEQLRFIEWLATPKRDRAPKTQQLFAREIGVNQDTLTDWKKMTGFRDDVFNATHQYLKSEMPEIMGALARKAKAGDVPAIKLATQLEGMLIERADVTSGGEPIQLKWPNLDPDAD